MEVKLGQQDGSMWTVVRDWGGGGLLGGLGGQGRPCNRGLGRVQQPRVHPSQLFLAEPRPRCRAGPEPRTYYVQGRGGERGDRVRGGGRMRLLATGPRPAGRLLGCRRLQGVLCGP